MDDTLAIDADITSSYRPRSANLSEDLVRVDLDICA